MACCKLKDVGEKLHRMIFLLGDGNLTAIACGFAMLHLIFFNARSCRGRAGWGMLHRELSRCLFLVLTESLQKLPVKGDILFEVGSTGNL